MGSALCPAPSPAPGSRLVAPLLGLEQQYIKSMFVSVLSSQFFYKSKTFLKNKGYFFKKPVCCASPGSVCTALKAPRAGVWQRPARLVHAAPPAATPRHPTLTPPASISFGFRDTPLSWVVGFGSFWGWA